MKISNASKNIKDFPVLDYINIHTLRLIELSKLPCIRCGNPHSEVAHSNSAKHIHGISSKSSDEFTVPLCQFCHFQFDTFQLGSRKHSEALFDEWLLKTNHLLKIDSGELFESYPASSSVMK